jgi:hypothetical protein
MNLSQPIRKAGTALVEFFSDPTNLKQVGKTVAKEAAFGAAAQQVVPRLIGQKPAATLPQSLLYAGAHSAVNVPVSGALRAAGLPELAAATTGQILGSAAASQFANRIEPEVTEAGHPEYADFHAMQQMHAQMEQQSYNNQIALALAKNYSTPTEIIHRNPSAEFQSMQSIINKSVPRYG